MANITIAGNSFVVTSDVAMADLEMVKKYRPSALSIVEPETKETLFKVGINNSGGGSVNDHGVTFGGTTNDEERLATATIAIPADLPDNQDAKEYVLDKAGLAIVQLDKIEAAVKTALEDVKDERNAIAERIIVSV